MKEPTKPRSRLHAAGEGHAASNLGPLKTGLIGWPVKHSVSPAMHNAAFEALGISGRYLLLPTELVTLEATVRDFRHNGFRGANITIPHKQTVMPFLDELSDASKAIGAVNTILVDGDRLLGHNTDAGGFLAALREVGCEPTGLRALVLGAGGAARAVVYALLSTGCPVSISNRTIARAEALAADLQPLAEAQGAVGPIALKIDLHQVDLDQFDLLVNTTSVGMSPKTAASPWPAGLALPPKWTVVDLVYNPHDTRLLAQARVAGATPVGGLGMLVHQGALSFQMWTGHMPPVKVMYAAASSALAEQARPPQTQMGSDPR